MRVAEMKRDMLRAANLKAAREAREERIREMQRIRGVVEVRPHATRTHSIETSFRMV